MALDRVRLRNYRGFVREVKLSLRPLTLLFGYNSAGKSALLRALPLVAESIRSTSGPLALDGRAAMGSSFRELRTRWTAGGDLEFGLDWSDGSTLDVEIADHRLRHRQIIASLRVHDEGEPDLAFESALETEETDDITPYSLRGDRTATLAFEGWRPSVVRGFERPDTEVAPRLLNGVGARLDRLAGSIHWLGALRARPPRQHELVGSGARVADDGSGTLDVLARESLSARSAVLEQVSAWFESATGHRLKVRKLAGAGRDLFYIELEPLGAAIGIHLADTGEGMTQVLPVITLGALAMAKRLGDDPILAIEQPELHLHPRAHSAVASHLIEVAKHARVVVETHAENLLLGVQLAIIDGRLSPRDVIVHWVRSTPEGPSYVESIEFDEKARPSSWPPGVFAEDRELQREIVERRLGLSS